MAPILGTFMASGGAGASLIPRSRTSPSPVQTGGGAVADATRAAAE